MRRCDSYANVLALHQRHKVCNVDASIARSVSLGDQLLDVLVAQALAEIVGDLFEVLERDQARVVDIEQLEGLLDLRQGTL